MMNEVFLTGRTGGGPRGLYSVPVMSEMGSGDGGVLSLLWGFLLHKKTMILRPLRRVVTVATIVVVGLVVVVLVAQIYHIMWAGASFVQRSALTWNQGRRHASTQELVRLCGRNTWAVVADAADPRGRQIARLLASYGFHLLLLGDSSVREAALEEVLATTAEPSSTDNVEIQYVDMDFRRSHEPRFFDCLDRELAVPGRDVSIFVSSMGCDMTCAWSPSREQPDPVARDEVVKGTLAPYLLTNRLLRHLSKRRSGKRTSYVVTLTSDMIHTNLFVGENMALTPNMTIHDATNVFQYASARSRWLHCSTNLAAGDANGSVAESESDSAETVSELLDSDSDSDEAVDYRGGGGGGSSASHTSDIRFLHIKHGLLRNDDTASLLQQDVPLSVPINVLAANTLAYMGAGMQGSMCAHWKHDLQQLSMATCSSVLAPLRKVYGSRAARRYMHAAAASPPPEPTSQPAPEPSPDGVTEPATASAAAVPTLSSTPGASPTGANPSDLMSDVSDEEEDEEEEVKEEVEAENGPVAG